MLVCCLASRVFLRYSFWGVWLGCVVMVVLCLMGVGGFAVW